MRVDEIRMCLCEGGGAKSAGSTGDSDPTIDMGRILTPPLSLKAIIMSH